MDFRLFQSRIVTAAVGVLTLTSTHAFATKSADNQPPSESAIEYYYERGVKYEGRGPDSLLIDRRTVLDEETCKFVRGLSHIRNIEVYSNTSIPLTPQEVECIVNGRELESLHLVDCSLSRESATELNADGVTVSALSLVLDVGDASGWLCVLRHQSNVGSIELLRQSAVSLEFSDGFRELRSLSVRFIATSGPPQSKVSVRVSGLQQLTALDVAFGDSEDARFEVKDTPLLASLSIDAHRITRRIDMNLQVGDNIEQLELDSLCVDEVNAAAWNQLGSLQSVRTLKLKGCHGWEKVCADWEMTKYLESLTLTDCGEGMLTGFTTASSLKSLTLERTFPCNASHIPGGVEELSLIGPMDTLADFRWVDELPGLKKFNMSVTKKISGLNWPSQEK